MFGLFKKKMPNEHLLKMERLAAEALNGIDGSYRNSSLAFKSFEIDITDTEQRQAVLRALKGYFQRLSHNPDKWIYDLQELDAERKSTKDVKNEEHAAFAIFSDLLKMNLLSKWALEYWDEKRIRMMVANVLATNGEALDAMARGGETEPPGSFEPGLSQEVYSEIIYADRFMKKLFDI